MIRIYGRAANRFGRQQTHWVTMTAVFCLCSDDYVPNFNWDDGTVDIKSFKYAPVMNKTITGDGWCAADQISFPPFVLDRQCSQAVIIDAAPAVGQQQPYFHIRFPTLFPSEVARPFTLLLGVNASGWFRL